MRNFFTLPNLLSLARIALGAAAMLAIAAGSLTVAAALIVTGALTAIATRCLKTPADPGKSLDATCDAIFQLAVFLAFLIKGWMPLWAALCVYSCEIALPYLRSFARQFEAQRSPRIFEQIKSAAFWASLLAAGLIAAVLGPDVAVQGVPVLLAIFVVDAALALVMLAVFLQVLVQAKRHMATSGR